VTTGSNTTSRRLGQRNQAQVISQSDGQKEHQMPLRAKLNFKHPINLSTVFKHLSLFFIPVMKKSLTSFCFAGICAVMAIASEARLLSPHALVTLPRPGGVVSAPSGRRAVFAQSEYNTTANKVSPHKTLIHQS
jgi:hypothetical protein